MAAPSYESIRLFESDFIEHFSHIRPYVVLVVWGPLVAFFGYLTFRNWPADQSALLTIPLVLSGILFWTLSEYVLHRFVFHFKAKSERGKRISFLFHGVHHAQPMEKTRLVMPPVVSIPIGVFFFGLFYLAFFIIVKRPYLLYPVFSGTILGYLLYDMTHYSLHHFKINKGYFLTLRKNHMRHHSKTPNKRFGVTTLLWDFVFGTMVKETEE